MRKEKIILLTLISFLLFLVLGPLELSAKVKFEEKFEKVIHLSKDGKVILKNISGNIYVKGWDKEEVKIKALKISKALTHSKAKENAEEVEIKVNKEDNTLLIETEYPKYAFRSINVSVNYNLMVPSTAKIRIKSVSGDITLEKTGGEVRAKTVSGNIIVEGTQTRIECKAISGDIVIKNTEGEINLSTISGDIEVTNVIGIVEADCVSGNIEIENSKVERIKAKTISGSITYRGEILPKGEYLLNSHSGDVKMEIPSKSAFDLEASTFSGKIKSEFEITVSREISKRKISGSVNGGGADIDLSSFSGNIILKKSKIKQIQRE